MDKRAVDSPRPTPETPRSPLDDYEANLRRSAEAKSRYQAESAARAAATAKAEAEHAKAVAAVNAQGSPTRARDAEERYRYSQQALQRHHVNQLDASPMEGESEYARAKRLNPGPSEVVNPATGFLRSPDMGEYTPRGGAEYAPGGTVHNVLHGAAKAFAMPAQLGARVAARLRGEDPNAATRRINQATSAGAEGLGRFGGSLAQVAGGVIPTVQHNMQQALGDRLGRVGQSLTSSPAADPTGWFSRHLSESLGRAGYARPAAAVQMAGAMGPASHTSASNVVQQAPQIAPYYIPGVGNWMMGNDAINEYRKGNYGRSTAYGAAASVPVVGPWAGRFAKGFLGQSRGLAAAGNAVSHAANLAPLVVPAVGEVAGAGQPAPPQPAPPSAAPTPAPKPMAALTPPKPPPPIPTPKKPDLAAMGPKTTGLA